jgi:hypothetical protein
MTVMAVVVVVVLMWRAVTNNGKMAMAMSVNSNKLLLSETPGTPGTPSNCLPEDGRKRKG